MAGTEHWKPETIHSEINSFNKESILNGSEALLLNNTPSALTQLKKFSGTISVYCFVITDPEDEETEEEYRIYTQFDGRYCFLEAYVKEGALVLSDRVVMTESLCKFWRTAYSVSHKMFIRLDLGTDQTRDYARSLAYAFRDWQVVVLSPEGNSLYFHTHQTILPEVGFNRILQQFFYNL